MVASDVAQAIFRTASAGAGSVLPLPLPQNVRDTGQAVPVPLVVLQNSKVNFKAKIKPEGAKWPSGKPNWTEVDTSNVDANNVATATKTFNDLSTSAGDTKKIKAICGNEVEKNIVVVKAELQEITFKEGHNVTHNSGSPEYKTQHWLKGRTPEGYPIAYTSGKPIKADVIFKCNPDIALTSGVKLAVRENSQSLGGKYSIGEKDATLSSGSTIKAEGLSSGNTDSSKVDMAFFSYEWQIKSTNAQIDWRPAETSANKLYLTYKEPITALRQETLYDLACGPNAGKTNQNQIVMGSYGRFTGRSVPRISDGTVMTYWKNWRTAPPPPDTVVDLLASSDGNGNCQAWSGLFRDVIRLNGIAGAQRMMVCNPPYSNNALSVLVIQWNFGTPPTSPMHPTYPYTMGQLAGTGVHAWPGNIAPGQGNPDTPPLFSGHWVTKWREPGYLTHTYYFDPSYGTGPVHAFRESRALKMYEDEAFAGFTNNIVNSSYARKNDTSSGSPSEVAEQNNDRD